MFGIGMGEFVVILVVGLIVFGPNKLPEIGKMLGKCLHEFRKAQAVLSETLNESVDEPKKSSPLEKNKTMTTDDLINISTETSLAKENNNENFPNSNVHNSILGDSRSSTINQTSNSSSIIKQSKP